VQQAEHGEECDATASSTFFCPHCGRPMLILETFMRGQMIRAPPRDSP
jgi:hypothetical protein